MLIVIPSAGLAQFLLSPQPGDVYKEFTRVMTGDDWRVTDPNIDLGVYPAAGAFLPNPSLYLSIDDLAGATRAEAVINIWGGHVGTYAKKISFNGNSWIDIPELGSGNGIPSGHDGYNYITQTDMVIPIPLGHLHSGGNTFQGVNGGQTGPYGFGWGQFGWYSIIVRVYYDGSKAHSTGSIISPSNGATIGENPTVDASVSGGTDRVDFLAYYDGYDTDGDGVWQEYHHDYCPTGYESEPTIKNHVGTATGGSSQVTWNTQYVPDQSGIKILARIRNSNGVWYVTPEVTGVTLQRSGSYVRLYKPLDTGERAWARGDLGEVVIHVDIPSGDNISNASEVSGFVRTWNGIDGAQEPGDYNYRKFNGYTDYAYGANHAFSFDIRNYPVSELQSGSNAFVFYSSNILHHGIEILWPGPGLIVRYGGSSSNVPPTITTHPANQLVTLGATATFSVIATGTPPLSYRWQKNGSDISGATSASYTTPATVSGDNGAIFRCIVTNPYGNATSNTATLTVGSSTTPPTITTHPSSQSVSLGATATFSVIATGTAPLTYQWQKNDVDISSATSASYTTPAVVIGDDNATFRCVVTNNYGTATSDRATLTIGTSNAPTITTHPANQTVQPGQTATFTVVASGTAPLTYQWQKNSVDISGATNASYTTPATTLADNGALFRCVVTNGGGSTNSNTASLTVTSSTTLQITYNPVDQLVGVGQPATFTVYATGTGTLTYQWQKDGSPVSGATNSSYTTPASALADSGTLYRCVVTDASNNATSASAMLKVTTGSVSVLTNSGFEGGAGSWAFHTDGAGTYTVVPAGPNNPDAARIAITQEGGNVQLYHTDVTVETGAEYIFFFRSQSSSGHNVDVSIQKHTSPYSSYGLAGQVYNLDTSWKDFSTQFTASGFPGVATDARVMFYLAPYDSASDNFYFDDVVLAKVTSIAPPAIATHPANTSAAVGATAMFEVIASGTPPFSYQWQKNAVDIAGATSRTYTTPAASAGDNGANFKCVVKNPVGNVTSNTAILTVGQDPLLAPTLLSPANGITNASPTQKFTWTKGAAGVTKYWFELAADSLFLTQRTVDSTLTDSTKTVTALTNGANYWWRVRVGNAGGWSPYSSVWRLRISTTDVTDNREQPETFALHQNYPNPFNPSTLIGYALPARSYVVLTVYNALGQVAATLVQGEQAAGYHEVRFDASELPSGLYLYRLQAGPYVETRKLVLMK
jgi:hypothetical protein